MSFDTIGDLNWFAVVAAAAIYFLLGGLWYSPVFLGKAMDAGHRDGDPGRG
jgi:hypothetical protein